MTETLDFKVKGAQTIHCASCEQRIDRALKRVPGIEEARASTQTQQVAVTIDPKQIHPEEVQSKLEQLGYKAIPTGGGP
jgi:copper chaperone CopZ